MQDVPVISHPQGAEVYADGKLVGQTPLSIPLSKDRDHIVSIVKQGYKPEDVIIRVYRDHHKELTHALLDGVHSGLFFKDAEWGVRAARNSLQRDQATGKHATLIPSHISVTLISEPAQKAPPKDTAANEPLKSSS